MKALLKKRILEAVKSGYIIPALLGYLIGVPLYRVNESGVTLVSLFWMVLNPVLGVRSYEKKTGYTDYENVLPCSPIPRVCTDYILLGLLIVIFTVLSAFSHPWLYYFLRRYPFAFLPAGGLFLLADELIWEERLNRIGAVFAFALVLMAVSEMKAVPVVLTRPPLPSLILVNAGLAALFAAEVLLSVLVLNKRGVRS